MKAVDPRTVVGNFEATLTKDGDWPNFHDAEIIDLHIWRGDVRPDDGVYVFPQITVRVELCALQHPFTTTLKFEDCNSVVMPGFNHQNPIMDLHFGLEERGFLNNGSPMTPYIVVHFKPCWEFGLSFKCFRASVVSVEGKVDA